MNPDGSKQSKRDSDNPDKPKPHIQFYKDSGYLPSTILNYLMLISFNNLPKEVFNQEEFLKIFKLNKLGNTPIKFDIDKLNWLNKQHIKKMEDSDFMSYFDYVDFDVLKLKSAILNRSKTTKDFHLLIKPLLNIQFNYLKSDSLQGLLKYITAAQFDPKSINDSIKQYVEDNNLTYKDAMETLRLQVFNNVNLPIQEVFCAYGKEFWKSYISIPNEKQIFSI